MDSVADGWRDKCGRELEATGFSIIDRDWEHHAIMVDLKYIPIPNRTADVKRAYFDRVFEK